MNKKISLYVLVGAVALTGCNKKMQDFAAEHFTTKLWATTFLAQ